MRHKIFFDGNDKSRSADTTSGAREESDRLAT